MNYYHGVISDNKLCEDYVSYCNICGNIHTIIFVFNKLQSNKNNFHPLMYKKETSLH